MTFTYHTINQPKIVIYYMNINFFFVHVYSIKEIFTQKNDILYYRKYHERNVTTDRIAVSVIVKAYYLVVMV